MPHLQLITQVHPAHLSLLSHLSQCGLLREAATLQGLKVRPFPSPATGGSLNWRCRGLYQGTDQQYLLSVQKVLGTISGLSLSYALSNPEPFLDKTKTALLCKGEQPDCTLQPLCRLYPTLLLPAERDAVNTRSGHVAFHLQTFPFTDRGWPSCFSGQNLPPSQ